MAVCIYNTLSRQKEPFVPIDDPVRFYCCGMTPKFHPHLGHAKLFVTMDVVRRYLRERGYRVRYVQNFTDVDDKIIARAVREGSDPVTVAQKYTNGYFQSMDALNVLPADVYPRATATIPGIIAMIEGLIAKGYAYAPGNGDVYYRVAAFPSYGKLSHRTEEDVQAGARIAVEERKEDPRDFALWKGAKEGEPAWPSPWGAGRPGWHIECSAMVRAELGEQIDIHAGGPDLIFPHHENEIAQSEAFTGVEPFSRYWLHIGQLNVDNEKMAHSLENFTTVFQVLERYHPVVLRGYYLSQQYRTPVNFTAESLEGSRRALERLVTARANLRALLAWPAVAAVRGTSGGALAAEAEQLNQQLAQTRREFYEAMDDDFNTAAALAALYALARELNRLHDALTPAAVTPQTASLLEETDRALDHLLELLGLQLPDDRSDLVVLRSQRRAVAAAVALVRAEDQHEHAPPDSAGGPSDEEIEAMLAKRAALRQERRYAEADALRQALADQGVTIEDRPGGAVWRRTR